MSVNVSNATTPSSKTPITITPAAAFKSWELIQEEDPNLKLRVSILGGGCHGFRYQFSFAETVEEDDVVIPAAVPSSSGETGDKTIDWVVGIMSLQFLKDAEIDYKSDLSGEQFIIRNLKTKTSCSCGHSFSAPDTNAASS